MNRKIRTLLIGCAAVGVIATSFKSPVAAVIEKNFITLHPEDSLRSMLHNGVAKSGRNLFPVIDNNEQLVGVLLLENIRNVMFDQSL